jgi:putative oxidoreductase
MSRHGRRFLEWPGHGWLAFPARIYLGVVFITACAHKILHPELFAMDVATYQFLPLVLVNLFAITLPWVELAAGAMLIVGWRARSAALLVALMMLAFMVALASALAQGLDMSCGCFASNAVAEEDPISWMTMLRDGGWLLLAVYVLVFDRCPLGFDRWLGGLRRAAQAEQKTKEESR